VRAAGRFLSMERNSVSGSQGPCKRRTFSDLRAIGIVAAKLSSTANKRWVWQLPGPADATVSSTWFERVGHGLLLGLNGQRPEPRKDQDHGCGAAAAFTGVFVQLELLSLPNHESSAFVTHSLTCLSASSFAMP